MLLSRGGMCVPSSSTQVGSRLNQLPRVSLGISVSSLCQGHPAGCWVRPLNAGSGRRQSFPCVPRSDQKLSFCPGPAAPTLLFLPHTGNSVKATCLCWEKAESVTAANVRTSWHLEPRYSASFHVYSHIIFANKTVFETGSQIAKVGFKLQGLLFLPPSVGLQVCTTSRRQFWEFSGGQGQPHLLSPKMET